MNPSLYTTVRQGMEEVDFEEKTYLREPLVLYSYMKFLTMPVA